MKRPASPRTRRAILEALAHSPLSDGNTIEHLLPLARGVEALSPAEPKLAVDTIARIVSRTGTYLPRDQHFVEGWTRELAGLLKENAIVSVEPHGVGNVNLALLVTFKNGRKAIFKPRSGELSYRDPANLSDILYTREIDAYTFVEHWLGNRAARLKKRSRIFVPPTAEIVLSHRGTAYGVGSLQAFQEGYVTLADFIERFPSRWRAIESSPQWAETQAAIRTVDFILGNHDRLPNSYYTQGNFSNLMVPLHMEDPDDLLVAMIDNGLGRPSQQGFDLRNLPSAAEMSPALRHGIVSLNERQYWTTEGWLLPRAAVEDVVSRLSATRARIRFEEALR